MHPFAFRRVRSVQDAVLAARPVRQVADLPPPQASAQFIAGGTNMVDYMALGVMRPDILVDINRIADPALRRVDVAPDGIRFGALVRMAEAEDHPAVIRQYPVIRDTLKLAATRQIRNMASLGGNTLQRTRCEYFRETSWPCNKLTSGSGCGAIGGIARQLAVLGTSDYCVANYPGDFAQALIALDASIETAGPEGGRRIKFSELHRPPGNTPHIETVLRPGEMITFIDVPAGPWTPRSRYLKIRDRTSYQFALTSAAVALDLEGDRVRTARIALGGVASVPWRAHEAEAVLTGQILDENRAAKAGEAAFAGARTTPDNAFKVPLGKQTVVRALLEAKAMEV